MTFSDPTANKRPAAIAWALGCAVLLSPIAAIAQSAPQPRPAVSMSRERDSTATPGTWLLEVPAPPVARDARPGHGSDPVSVHATWLSRGGETAEPVSVSPAPLGALTTALRPVGLNAFFIDYRGRRWFSSGPTVLLDPAGFTATGEYFGFPVYVTGDRQSETIYVPVAIDVKGLLTPYSTRR